MYKLQKSNNIYSIDKGNKSIPTDPANSDYQQFIQDVAEQGIDIVEGPDVVEPSYSELRTSEYPPITDQLDKIYHSGVTAWKKDIKEIKDKHPKTITGGITIGDVPDWVQTAVDNWTFNKQLREYVDAVERLELDAVVASDDIPATVEVSTTNPETMEVTTETVANPVIVKDEEERAAAQAVVDATPQSVIDSINN
tara:strand:+ start:528 stop:1115 length:588 start_codon:yes stop_codon:yes gene_type:complete